jgi:PAS domain S-box-containing protein
VSASNPTEEAPSAPGELLRQIFDNQSQAFAAALDGMAILRADQTYAYLNEAHARLYGYDRPEELLGLSWRLLYEPAEAARFEREIMPLLWAAGRWHGEAVGRRKDGRTFPQEVSLSAIAGGGFVCIVRDITERKEAEKLQAALYRIADTTSTVTTWTRSTRPCTGSWAS